MGKHRNKGVFPFSVFDLRCKNNGISIEEALTQYIMCGARRLVPCKTVVSAAAFLIYVVFPTELEVAAAKTPHRRVICENSCEFRCKNNGIAIEEALTQYIMCGARRLVPCKTVVSAAADLISVVFTTELRITASKTPVPP